MGVISASPGIVTYHRRSPPAHYLLEIGSYSTLLKPDLDKYQSGVFEVGGYKWSLTLYPKGNKKENGSNHISLYLGIEEMNKSHSWEVKVKYKFFLLDQQDKTYLTFEDDKVRAFDKGSTEWGIPQLVHLDAFKEHYLKNDSCIFGVEILILNHNARKEEYFYSESVDAYHVWEIKNFKSLTEEYYYHPGFVVGGCKWRLMVWPKGNGDEKNNSMSVFLELADSGRHRNKRRVYAEYKLRVRDQIEDVESAKHGEITGSQWFSPCEAYGRRDMISLKDLHDKSKAYVKNNTVIVDVTIVVISKVSFKSSLVVSCNVK